ncbi:protein eva-1 homolog C isoform X4 [Eubalaena glacialis]|uniref:protein eva-1 homolog C isoform X4 n=1 Tax=Eubalaena glacialis TaxID=27606 RepID=UPI002A5A56FC|nr:protein eva-1 homolog C isoform X4 [Eubalaena glacialis]
MLLPGHARPPPAPQPAQHPGLRRQAEPPGQLLRLFYCTVLVCSKEISALTDFSGKKRPPSLCDPGAAGRPGYLTKLLQNHTAYACDGDRLDLQCPRHSTISVQSAFYGHDYQTCSAQQPASQREDSLACVAPTTLQKVLDECQNQRTCHLLVNSRVFGPDLCPGSSKYLLVSFKCQPNELKNKTVCEDHELKLHCHESKFLNIYSATYGRKTQERDVCSSEATWLPPFDCLSYSALQVLSRRCYGKQRCKILVNNHHFGSPCLPGVKKYLTVAYACVPKNILTAIDPAVANLKPSVKQKDGDYGINFDPRKPRVLRKDGVMVSHSLAAFAYLRASLLTSGETVFWNVNSASLNNACLPLFREPKPLKTFVKYMPTLKELPCCSCPVFASVLHSHCVPWSSECPAPRTSGSCSWRGSTWCQEATKPRRTARMRRRRRTPLTPICQGNCRGFVGLHILSAVP